MSLVQKRIIIYVISGLIAFTSVNAFENPIINSSGQVGTVQLYSAKSLGLTRLVFNTQADFAYDPGLIYQVINKDLLNGELDTLYPEIALCNLRPGFAFGVTSFMDISAFLPIYFDLMSSYVPQAGIGDVELGLKFRIPGNKPRKFQAALFSAVSFPTGSSNGGYFPRHTYYFDKDSTEKSLISDYLSSPYSSQKIESAFSALLTLDLNRFLFHVNSGVRLTYNKLLDEALLLGAALEVHPSNRVAFFTEMSSETRFYNVGKEFMIANDPLRITPGITLSSPGGATFTLAGSFKLSSGRNRDYYNFNREKLFTAKIEPAWRAMIQFGWSGLLMAQDRDRDLIRDEDDACPEDAEDLDGFEDSNGCPDLDNDFDGIADSLDKCPDKSEDFDGFEDEDGCQDYDNDHDGIPDSTDRCIDVPEDMDGFNDEDGCPDYDNDNDGISDSLDKCIILPEDRDGFEDEDGCPDIDNDMDGVSDSLDHCPDSAGIAENNGCPKARPNAKEIKRGRVILPGVHFEGGSDILLPESFAVLDQVVASLEQWTQIRLEIQAHTDNSASAASSLGISKKRAITVCKYLESKGIDKARLNPVGKGDVDPIADNSTIHGRKLNNRIEIHRRD